MKWVDRYYCNGWLTDEVPLWLVVALLFIVAFFAGVA